MRSPRLPFWVINLAIFQVGWLLAALSLPQSAEFMALLVIVHFALSPSLKSDILLLLLALPGVVMDQLLISSGILLVDQPVIPAWLTVLWLLFALAIGHSLSWLQRLPLLAVVVVGAVAGPLSYLAGQKLGALSLAQPEMTSLAIMAACWGVILPLLTWLTRDVFPRYLKLQEGT